MSPHLPLSMTVKIRRALAMSTTSGLPQGGNSSGAGIPRYFCKRKFGCCWPTATYIIFFACVSLYCTCQYVFVGSHYTNTAKHFARMRTALKVRLSRLFVRSFSYATTRSGINEFSCAILLHSFKSTIRRLHKDHTSTTFILLNECALRQRSLAWQRSPMGSM